MPCGARGINPRADQKWVPVLCAEYALISMPSRISGLRRGRYQAARRDAYYGAARQFRFGCARLRPARYRRPQSACAPSAIPRPFTPEETPNWSRNAVQFQDFNIAILGVRRDGDRTRIQFAHAGKGLSGRPDGRPDCRRRVPHRTRLWHSWRGSEMPDSSSFPGNDAGMPRSAHLAKPVLRKSQRERQLHRRSVGYLSPRGRNRTPRSPRFRET